MKIYKLITCNSSVVVEILLLGTLEISTLFYDNFHDIFELCKCKPNGLKFWENTQKMLNHINTNRPWQSAHDKHTLPYKSSYGHLKKINIASATILNYTKILQVIQHNTKGSLLVAQR